MKDTALTPLEPGRLRTRKRLGFFVPSVPASDPAVPMPAAGGTAASEEA